MDHELLTEFPVPPPIYEGKELVDFQDRYPSTDFRKWEEGAHTSEENEGWRGEPFLKLRI